MPPAFGVPPAWAVSIGPTEVDSSHKSTSSMPTPPALIGQDFVLWICCNEDNYHWSHELCPCQPSSGCWDITSGRAPLQACADRAEPGGWSGCEGTKSSPLTTHAMQRAAPPPQKKGLPCLICAAIPLCWLHILISSDWHITWLFNNFSMLCSSWSPEVRCGILLMPGKPPLSPEQSKTGLPAVVGAWALLYNIPTYIPLSHRKSQTWGIHLRCNKCSQNAWGPVCKL